MAIRLAHISSDYWEEDKLDKSEAYERNAISLSSRLVSRSDPLTLKMIGDFGTIVDLEGETDETELAYGEHLKGEQALNPPNLPDLGLAWNYKGWLHCRLGLFSDAEQKMRHALEMRIAAYGETHPVTAGARASLAYILLCRQKSS